MLHHRLVIVALLFVATCASARLPLPASVDAELHRAGIPQAAVSVIVQPAGNPGRRASLIELNADQSRNPASVMKLVTTWTALAILGPAHTWTTSAYARGAIANGVLHGDLIIQGSGDPKLTQEQFWLLLRQIRARGLQGIEGDLVLDRSLFAPVAEDTEFDDQPMRAYNVAPDALLLNFKSLRLTLTAQRDGRVAAIAEPPLTSLPIVNSITASASPCGDWKDGLAATLTDAGGHRQLMIAGTFPAACGEKAWNLGVLSHRDYIDAVFRDLWHELGGGFTGEVRDGSLPSQLEPIASIESPPLAEIVRDINKYSNNVMARQLFLSLAPQTPATTQAAGNAVMLWLARNGIVAPELVLENGAGLSRRERVSAATLAQLLQGAAASPLAPEFIASLPLAAIDGTMRKRLADSGVAGHAHVKTGTLDGVKSMAGYVQDAQGRMMIVVFMANHANADRAQAAEDALLRWVYQH